MKKQIVKIEWVDSKGITDKWEYLSDIENMKPNVCTSVGYLLNDTEEYKEICQSISNGSPDNVQIIGRISIPTCSVRRIKKL